VAGLGSFLVGHIAYVVGLQSAPTSVAGTVAGLVVVGLGIAVVGRRVVAGVAAGDHRELVGPVIAYLTVISAMVVSAFGTEAPWAIVGASLFYASDATLAWNRFLAPLRWGPLAVMVTYHLGQAGLVAWLVTG
ncbi:MAG: lysoplasmalogenase, partial [Actinobacteria bacterium]|nr:lysoplasmalogenase [Actinomycetota bacterium]